jgi:hypothetical protein
VANELFATLEDINAHLPEHKAQIEDADDDLLQVEAYRLIRAKLSSTFAATTLNTWASPTTTPGIIRTIAGMVIAAKWFAELYAEDSDEDATYANNLYAQAMGLIEEIRAGLIIVTDPTTDDPLGDLTYLSSDDYYPNDTVPPKFTMDKEFA